MSEPKTWIDILKESSGDSTLVQFTPTVEKVAADELDKRGKEKIIFDYNGRWNAFVMGDEKSKPVGVIPNVEL